MLFSTLGLVLTAKVVLALLLALGPVFAALLLFEQTRGMFDGWLRAAFAFAFIPLFTTLALMVQLTCSSRIWCAARRDAGHRPARLGLGQHRVRAAVHFFHGQPCGHLAFSSSHWA